MRKACPRLTAGSSGSFQHALVLPHESHDGDTANDIVDNPVQHPVCKISCAVSTPPSPIFFGDGGRLPALICRTENFEDETLPHR